MLDYSWANVADFEPKLIQFWVDISCLLGRLHPILVAGNITSFNYKIDINLDFSFKLQRERMRC